MSYADMKAHRPRLRLELTRLADLTRCPDCGEFYRTRFSFYCRESQGMETEEAVCPTWECREAQEATR